MKQITLMEKYPVNTLEINKSNTTLKSCDEILDNLQEKINAHPVAVYIATFDHYTHTKSLEVGEIAKDILDAKNIVFCFGKMLPKPELMGVRPRSIGVCETNDSFVISFMEAPNPDANKTMQEWAQSIANA